MPVDFCRHLVGKTLINVSVISPKYAFLVAKVGDHKFITIFLNKLIQFYLNNTIIFAI